MSNTMNKADSSINVSNVILDVSKLTTIPIRSLDKLVSKVCWCICDATEETLLNGENIAVVDVGIGQLCIQIDSDEIQYKFIPSAKLEKYMIDTVVNKKNPMVVNLESTFVNRIVKTYKDMI